MPNSPTNPRAAVILLAAGDGRRVGAEGNKVLLPLSGLPVFAWSLRWIRGMSLGDAAFGNAAPGAAVSVDRVVVVVRGQDRAVVQQVLDDHFADLEVTVVLGGPTRHGSELNALSTLADVIDSGAIDVVAIHDAARPLADAVICTAVIRAASEHGGALPVREQRSLLARDSNASSVTSDPTSSAWQVTGAGTAEGTSLVGVQTPQAFRAQPLLDACRAAERDGFVGTDTASCIERYADLEIHCVPGDATNLKITFPEDVALAERLLEKRCPEPVEGQDQA